VSFPYPVARLLGSLAETEAVALGVPVTIVVSDDEGAVVLLGRMDGALPASREIAVAKAYTAAALRMSTDELGKLAQPGQALYGIQHTHPGKMVLFGGGVPLRLKGKVAGAIGISGGTVQEDIQVADSVVKALTEMEKWSRVIKKWLPRNMVHESWTARMEITLSETLKEMSHPLSPREHFILAGAIILAAREAEEESSW
jgi:uncharacterized protein GlcG (DUF336 family)